MAASLSHRAGDAKCWPGFLLATWLALEWGLLGFNGRPGWFFRKTYM